MPYANSHEIELSERMAYLDKQQKGSQNPETTINGQTYYENLCLKAINQSIGRAIRHKNDRSMVFLVDSRYSDQKIINQLPKWTQPYLKVKENIESVESDIREFYKTK